MFHCKHQHRECNKTTQDLLYRNVIVCITHVHSDISIAFVGKVGDEQVI